MHKKEILLVINPGSTSTKIAVFENETTLLTETMRHPDSELAPYPWVMDQVEYRKAHIEQFLKDNGFDISTLTCVMSRGGQLPPVPSGAFEITQDMIDFVYTVKVAAHASNTGCVIAYEIAKEHNIPAYVYDPITVDELSPVARITGLPELPKQSRGHALNTHAMAHQCAKKVMGKPTSECTFIVAHLGGGCSVWLIHKGYSIDMYGDDDAGFCPERCGRLQAVELTKLCYSGKYTLEELSRRLRGGSGMRVLLGTTDVREVEARIAAGDEYAKLVHEAFTYNIAKSIGDLATVVCGNVDRIILTGGIAYSKMITDDICARVGFIAPVELMPGEYEMEALAAGCLRVLRGEEQPKAINWPK